MKPTKVQEKHVTAALDAMRSAYRRQTGEDVPEEVAKVMLLAATPHIRRFVIDVETEALEQAHVNAKVERSPDDADWWTGHREGWMGALRVLRTRAAWGRR